MILELDKLLSEDTRLVGDEVVMVPDATGTEIRIDCRVEVGVRKAGESFYIHADLIGNLTTNCHKCLEEFQHRVTPSFDVVVQRSRTGVATESREGDDFISLPYGTTRFSLESYIYENLVLDIPMKILCRDDCRGLCSGCGVNLNAEKCRCDAPAEPGWDALKKLAKKQDDQ
jgi:uncharacterized protein